MIFILPIFIRYLVVFLLSYPSIIS